MGGVKIDRNLDPSIYQINSSRTTIFSLLNSMVGGTMLLLPIMFNNTGFIISPIIIIVSGLISCKASDIYIQHLKKNEFDVQDVIQRIMGRRWKTFFLILQSFNLFVGSLVYYLFAVQMLYSIITFIQEKSGNHNYASKDEINFDKFSVQYLVLGTYPFFLALVFLKDLTFLIKIAELGVYAIYSYVIFIFYAFISNIIQGNLINQINQIKLFSFDLGNLSGTASSAFQIQTNVCPMVKCNKDQTKNRRDVKITYLLGTLVYLTIGIIGGFGVMGRQPQNGTKEASTIVDFFKTSDWQPLIVEILYLIHLISMYPILFNLCRSRIFDLIYSKQGGNPPKAIFVFSNVLFVFLCGGIKFGQVQPDDFVSLNGSITLFFIVYLIPPLIQLSCYHGSNKFLRSIKKSFTTKNNLDLQQLSLTESLQQQKECVEIIDDKEFGKNELQKHNKVESCNDHVKDIKFLPKNVRIFVYSIILLIGIAILAYGLYDCIKKF